MGQTIQIPTEGMQCIGAYRANPSGAVRGGIVVVQEIYGVNAYVRRVADRFGAQGFIAIAPALFDFVETGVELDYDAADTAKGRAIMAEVGFERSLSAVASAAETIASAGPIGVTGFCWGGTVAFLSATRLGLPAVVYYGGRSVPFLGERPRAPLLFHFGERDPIIPATDVQKHRDALADIPHAVEIHVYPAGHAFDRDADHHFEPVSAALAFERTLAFFGRTLRS